MYQQKSTNVLDCFEELKPFFQCKIDLQATILSSSHYSITLTLYGVIRTIPPSWTNYRSFRTRLQRQSLTLLCCLPPLKLSKLHWHPLTHRRFLHRMVTTFKLKYNLIDCNFDLPKINHLYNTRQRDHIHLSKPNTNWGKQKLLYHACKEYNDLDNNIKSIKELNSFYNALLKSPKY